LTDKVTAQAAFDGLGADPTIGDLVLLSGGSSLENVKVLLSAVGGQAGAVVTEDESAQRRMVRARQESSGV
jgi:hypothetical protein